MNNELFKRRRIKWGYPEQIRAKRHRSSNRENAQKERRIVVGAGGKPFFCSRTVISKFTKIISFTNFLPISGFRSQFLSSTNEVLRKMIPWWTSWSPSPLTQCHLPKVHEAERTEAHFFLSSPFPPLPPPPHPTSFRAPSSFSWPKNRAFPQPGLN